MSSSPLVPAGMAPSDREQISDASNPLGIHGIEFIEYATTKPQALGQVLETMGFRPVARHRSREVLLYRQGDMNVIVNAHVAACLLPVESTSKKYGRLGRWPITS